jgi:amidase
VDDAVSLLTELGHEVVAEDPVELPATVGTLMGRMYGAMADWVVRYWEEELGRSPAPGDLEPVTERLWQSGKQVSAGELLMAHMHFQRFAYDVAAAYDDPGRGFDVWLSPTVAGPAPALGQMLTTLHHDGSAAASRWVAFPLLIANLTGRAAMSVPLSSDEDGLPVGVHLMGGYGGEDLLFRLAAQLEQARPWPRVWPPVSAPCLAHHHPR